MRKGNFFRLIDVCQILKSRDLIELMPLDILFYLNCRIEQDNKVDYEAIVDNLAEGGSEIVLLKKHLVRMDPEMGGIYGD